MKKLLPFLLAFALLLGLGVPALAAGSEPIRGWDHVVQIMALEEYADRGHVPVTIALCSDGTVLYDGPENSDYAAVKNWTGVVRLEKEWMWLVGFRADGSVLTTASFDLSGWTGIRQVVMNNEVALGLRSDGTVACAQNPEKMRYVSNQEEWDFESWTDVVALLGRYDPMALRADGTLYMSASEREYLSDSGWGDPKDWTDIVALGNWLYGEPAALKADGTVIGFPEEEWHDIVSIYSLPDSAFGLRADGTVAVYPAANPHYTDERLERVREWTDIAALSAGGEYRYLPVGLHSDGTAVCVTVDWENEPNGVDLSGWTDLRGLFTNSVLTLGLRSDGTVLLARDHTEDGDEILPAFEAVRDWSDIVDIAVSEQHAVGLRADGTVVSTASGH